MLKTIKRSFKIRIAGALLLKRSAIILAGGASSRFGCDKGVLKLAKKPLIWHVVSTAAKLAEEIIIVTNSQERIIKYSKILPSTITFAIDREESKSPLIGAATGFEIAHGKYSLLLPFDTPFISQEALSLLFDSCDKRAAVIPRWPNGHIEPLQAVYETNMAFTAAKLAIEEGKLNLRSMIEKLKGVRYISTLIFQQIDPDLRIFFNINNVQDLKIAENMIRRNF